MQLVMFYEFETEDAMRICSASVAIPHQARDRLQERCHGILLQVT